ncbi:MAG: hypothetical protein JWO13_2731 [Acidobacteriales bacterium]|nr:hypothetical protein [Terriglobales bacterium]
MRKQNERAELFGSVAERFLAINIPTRTADKNARLAANVESLNQWFCAAPIDSLTVEWVEEFALAILARAGEAQMLSQVKTLDAILTFGLSLKLRKATARVRHQPHPPSAFGYSPNVDGVVVLRNHNHSIRQKTA